MPDGKQYLAIVKGMIDYSGKLIDFIDRDGQGNSYISKSGKEAILDYNLVDYNKEHDCSLVAIKLETGRHHQIRIQFSSRGHYLLGDQRYGVQDNKQICLFSYYLSFTHPVSKEKLEFFELPPNISYWTFFTLSKYVSVIKHLHL